MNLHTHVPHESTTCPIDFGIKRSKVKAMEIDDWKWFPDHYYVIHLRSWGIIHFIPMSRGCTLLIFGVLLLFSSPEPKARVSYCHSAPSVRRKLFTFSTSSPEPLDLFWWNLVGMKYSWSLTSVVVFRADPCRGGSRAGQSRSRWSPSSTNFFRQVGYSNKPNT